MVGLETSLAWAAGIVDGEGCVGTCRSNNNLYARVSVTNTSIKMLRALRAILGGAITPVKRRLRPGYRNDNKPAATWFISGRNARDALFGILPYLVAKKSQAFISVLILDSCRQGNRHVSRETRMLRHTCMCLIRWLNRRQEVHAHQLGPDQTRKH